MGHLDSALLYRGSLSPARANTSRDATRTHLPTRPSVVETTTPVDLLGRYSNPDNVSRLHRILSGQGRDRPSHRPVPSVRQKQTRLTDSQRSELLDRYLAGETATALAKELGVHRATVFSVLRRAGVPTRYRILSDADVAIAQQHVRGWSLLGDYRRTLRRVRPYGAERVPPGRHTNTSPRHEPVEPDPARSTMTCPDLLDRLDRRVIPPARVVFELRPPELVVVREEGERN